MNGKSERISPRLVGIVAGAAFLVSACGLGGGASSAPASAEASAAASTAPSAAAPSVAGDIRVATDATLGQILTGEGGKTLYVFKKDTGGKSVCNGDCAVNWPPLLADAGASATAGEGVTGTLGTTVRDDGTTQVTYQGAPLYYFVGDKAAGETNGQGLNDVWFVATPTGSSESSKGVY
jgi:predicted lipoprotein with Yx(FWY)xxD motif